MSTDLFDSYHCLDDAHAYLLASTIAPRLSETFIEAARRSATHAFTLGLAAGDQSVTGEARALLARLSARS